MFRRAGISKGLFAESELSAIGRRRAFEAESLAFEEFRGVEDEGEERGVFFAEGEDEEGEVEVEAELLVELGGPGLEDDFPVEKNARFARILRLVQLDRLHAPPHRQNPHVPPLRGSDEVPDLLRRSP